MDKPEDKLTKEFLTELLARDDVSADEKIGQIISEHNAYNRALVEKRNELLGEQTKLKEKITAYETEKGSYETKIGTLEEELKKASSDDHKKYYETQIADLKKSNEEALLKVSTERDYYKGEHLKALRDRAIEEGVKDLHFINGLKDGFIARVLMTNDFHAEEIEGVGTKFLNKEHHTIEEAIHNFAMTPEGKAYIANPSTGGGAKGSGSSYSGGSSAKTMSRSAYSDLQARDPKQASEFFKNGGRLVD